MNRKTRDRRAQAQVARLDEMAARQAQALVWLTAGLASAVLLAASFAWLG